MARRFDRIQVALIVAFVVVAAAGVAALIVASSRHPNDVQGVWFTAIGSIVALVALLAGIVAVLFAVPGYRALRAEQRTRAIPAVSIQYQDDEGKWISIDNDATVEMGSQIFTVRALVNNQGDAVLRWGILNIQVPLPCTIDTDEDNRPYQLHHKASTPFDSADLYDDRTVQCWCTVAERDYPPVHAFIYVVTITAKEGTWPVAAVLEGADPYVRASTRVYVRVGGHDS